MSNTQSFKEFLSYNVPQFNIDSDNEEVIQLLDDYAHRRESFNSPKRNLDKGIVLIGNVGTGKTILFRYFSYYLNYLQSILSFTYHVAWKFAEAFSEKGYYALQEQRAGNRYYDELCLFDERTGNMVKERAKYYGNEVVIGEELIRIRYDAFTDFGYKTFFTTNANKKQLENIYGQRIYSRLEGMCNFLALVGDDRRKSAKPIIHNDRTGNIQQHTVRHTVSEKELRDSINESYKSYRGNKKYDDMYAYTYSHMTSLGEEIFPDETMWEIYQGVYNARKEEINLGQVPFQDAQRKKKIESMYNEDKQNELDREEKRYLTVKTRAMAMIKYFDKMITEDKEYIFPTT